MGNNTIQLSDFLRAHSHVMGHDFTPAHNARLRIMCSERLPFAVVIGKTCGIRFHLIDMARYFASMRELWRSMQQGRTVLVFTMKRGEPFVMLDSNNYQLIYQRFDPAEEIRVSTPSRTKAREFIPSSTDWLLSPVVIKDDNVYRQLRDYLYNKCLRTPERQRPRNRCRRHGFACTYAANELMSRY